MRIAAVDDDRTPLAELQALCRDYAQARSRPITLDLFTQGGDLLKVWTPRTYSLVFVDIYMEPMDGIRLARELRQRQRDLCIVFLTTSGDFMPEAFSLHAFHYIQKPYTREQLFSVLDDALRILPRQENRLDIMCGGHLEHLCTGDIVSAVSDAHYLQISTLDGKQYRTRMTLSDFLEAVTEHPSFLQINKGIVINMDFVSSVDGQSCCMETGTRHPIKVRDRVQIERQIRSYIFGKLRDQQGGSL